MKYLKYSMGYNKKISNPLKIQGTRKTTESH